jgi:hypothetical protein
MHEQILYEGPQPGQDNHYGYDRLSRALKDIGAVGPFVKEGGNITSWYFVDEHVDVDYKRIQNEDDVLVQIIARAFAKDRAVRVVERMEEKLSSDI